MVTCYKLTSSRMLTKNDTLWGENITHELPIREIYTLCSGDVIHGYPSAELAVLMDIIHGRYLPNGILWECEGEEVIFDGTKSGYRALTTLKQIPIPSCTLNQRIVFGILCVKHVYKDPAWNSWADKWLSGADRSEKGAYAARAAAYAAAARAAAYAAAAADAAADAAVRDAAAYAADAAAIAAADIINNDYYFINDAAKAALSKEY